MAKKKYPTFTSGPGRAQYVFLNEPRAHHSSPDKLGYDATLVFAKTEGAALRKLIDDQAKRGQKEFGTRKLANLPYEENEDGTVTVKFRVPASTQTRSGRLWERKPAFFDTEGTPLTGKAEPQVGPGSVINLAFQFYVWKTGQGVGVTLQPVAVQVIDLVAPGGSGTTAEGFGFAKSEGGFKGRAEGFGDEDEDEDEDTEVPF